MKLFEQWGFLEFAGDFREVEMNFVSLLIASVSPPPAQKPNLRLGKNGQHWQAIFSTLQGGQIKHLSTD